MGVLTTVYQVPVSIMDKVIENPDLLEHLFYPEYREEGDTTPEDVGLSADWKPKDYGFDKMWEDYVDLYGSLDHRHITRALESEVTEVEHSGGAYIRYWSADEVQRLSKLLNQFTTEEFHAQAVEKMDELTDWDGRPYEHEIELGYVTSTHGSFAEFVKGAADAADAMFASSS